MRERRNEKNKEKAWGTEGVFERFLRLEEERMEKVEGEGSVSFRGRESFVLKCYA